MVIRNVFVIGLLLFGQVTGSFLSIVEAKGKALTVRGEVMALNTKDATQVMVIRVITQGGRGDGGWGPHP